MIWTIITVLILVAAVVLYMFGGMFLEHDAKKTVATKDVFMHKGVSALAIIVIAFSVCRLWTPVYLVHTNPAILQEMVQSMQAQQEQEKNKNKPNVCEHGNKKAARIGRLMGYLQFQYKSQLI